MGKIGEIYIGGYIEELTPAVSGIVFSLSNSPNFDYKFLSNNENWEVELKRGMNIVVARSSRQFSRNEILVEGTEEIQKCLDLVCYQKKEVFTLSNSGGYHIIVFLSGNDIICEYYSKETLRLIFSSGSSNNENGFQRAKDWNEVLRFYRLSQASADLSDAYRNLFLAFELLISQISSKKKNENEVNWLKRVLSKIHHEINLNKFVPPKCENPSAYIVQSQYKEIRCFLFHSKEQLIKKPLNPEKIFNAYKELLNILRHILEKKKKLRGGGSGIVTNSGLDLFANKSHYKDVSIHFTSDSTPISKQDTKISPNGYEVMSNYNIEIQDESEPGNLTIKARYKITSSMDDFNIHRLGMKSNERLLVIDEIKEGLNLKGINYFEVCFGLNFFNKNSPKTSFQSHQ